jgi:tetratricopeptide (TPR) repeat protein
MRWSSWMLQVIDLIIKIIAALKLSQNDKKVQLKAYLRRAHSYFNRAFYSKALQDIASALEIDPNSVDAKKLSIDATKKLNDVGDGHISAPRKMKIIDVENEEEEVAAPQLAPAAEPSAPVTLSPLVIQEIDEDEEDEVSTPMVTTEKESPEIKVPSSPTPITTLKIDQSKRKAKTSAEFESILKGFKRSKASETDIQSHLRLYSADQLSQYLSTCIDQALLEEAIQQVSDMARGESLE